jgi:8-oxo-dGTP pyrophosphatase MutT (NUDIX family)
MLERAQAIPHAETSAIPVVTIERLELTFAPRPWLFATERRAEIDAHFARRKLKTPALWNGRVLMLHEHAIVHAVLRGAFLETDFASYIAWRDWGFPDATVRNCFALGALRASDGGYLLGVMGQHTVSAGHIYFPGGVPDETDVVGDRVDLTGNLMREISEETGLTPADVGAEPGWLAVIESARIALVKVLDVAGTAEDARARILANLARQDEPELADIRIVRGPADFDAAMPRFVTAYLAHVWSGAT